MSIEFLCELFSYSKQTHKGNKCCLDLMVASYISYILEKLKIYTLGAILTPICTRLDSISVLPLYCSTSCLYQAHVTNGN